MQAESGNKCEVKKHRVDKVQKSVVVISPIWEDGESAGRVTGAPQAEPAAYWSDTQLGFQPGSMSNNS